MLNSLKTGIKGIIFFQSIWTIGIMVKLNVVLDFFGYAHVIHFSIMQTLLVAVFFHMLTLNLIIYLLYMELQFEAAMSSFLYLLLNIALTLCSIYIVNVPPGTSYLAASLITSIYCSFHLYRKAPVIDFIIFSRT